MSRHIEVGPYNVGAWVFVAMILVICYAIEFYATIIAQEW